MKLFVLSGCISYEDREILGIYKSVEDARYQAEEVDRELGGYDYYEVSVHKVGGEALMMEVVDRWDGRELVDSAS